MKPQNSRMVLFVCVENTFRSIMSEAIFNAHAPTGWHAESAGVQPAETINPTAIELLREIGIELGPKTPRLVTPELTARAWRVITFGCLDRCPIGAKEKSEDWPILGSTRGKDGPVKSPQELHAIRDELQRRILGLIEEIKRSSWGFKVFGIRAYRWFRIAVITRGPMAIRSMVLFTNAVTRLENP